MRVLGVKTNYNVSGLLNYNQGFKEQESGIYNSNVQGNLSTSLGDGFDLVGGLNVSSDYSFGDYKNKVRFAPNLKLMKDNFQLTIGYDKHIAKSLFSSVVATNEDTNFSHNLLAKQVSNYTGYIGYTVTIKSIEANVSADLDGGYYAGAKVPVMNGDLSFSLYSVYSSFGAYMDFSSNIDEHTNAAVGLGIINNELATVLSVGRFFNDDVYMYSNVIGYEKSSTGTVGAEYNFGSISVYAEGTVNLFGESENNTGASVGAKLFF
ncbi:hypothetical protein [Photobacterium kishitanii]|nr:hypothetical protein [Photobacterium kishitanii]